MLFCNDRALTFLKSQGYLVVRLPKADITPLQLCEIQGNDLNRLGLITSLLVPDPTVPPPIISSDIPATGISGQASSALSFGVGISILGSIIGAMGGTTMGLRAQYQSAKTITFLFKDVLENRIDVLELDKYLGAADVDPDAIYTNELLQTDSLAIVTNTIKSSKIAVEAMDSRGNSLTLSTSAIQGIVGDVQVSQTVQRSSLLTYEGKVPLVFGFQARRLFYDNGQYRALKPANLPLALKGLPSELDDGTVALTSEATFVHL